MFLFISGNQSILKEVSPEYSLEGLKLKLQQFGHLMQKKWLIGKDPDTGKDRRQEERGRPRMRGLNGIDDSMDMSLRNLMMDRETWRGAVLGVAKSRTWLSDWIDLNWKVIKLDAWPKSKYEGRRLKLSSGVYASCLKKTGKRFHPEQFKDK